MSKKLEEKLKSKARKLGLSGDSFDDYVYGTLRKKGWKPKREKNKKRY